jgi:hypothetical protein
VVGQIAAMLDREARAGALAIDRPEFAAEPPISRSESHLGFIAAQLAKRPTRRDLAETAHGTIFCTAVVTTLCVWLIGLWQNHIERILAGWVGELAVPNIADVK